MRKSIAQRVFFQVHLWLGLGLGLYAFLMGITGSVLVFHEEIAARIAPPPVMAQDGPSLPMENIRQAIQAQSPGWRAWSLEAPAQEGEPWRSYLLQKGKGKMVIADGRGQIIGETNLEGTWLRVAEQFHSYLLIPKGRLYNGVAGLVLMGVALSGAVLWWPKQEEWRNALRVVRVSNWKGIVYDLHRVGGALSFAFVVLFCGTGAYFTWPAAYRDIASWVLPTKPKVEKATITGEGPRLPVDHLAAAAMQQVPGTRLVRVLVPDNATTPVTVVVGHGDHKEQRTTTQIQVHPHTGEVLSVDDYRARQAGDHVVSWMGPLHTGHLGHTGWKIVWAIAGLTLPALFVTGFLMWCNRVIAPRIFSKAALSASSSASGPSSPRVPS